MSADSIDQSNIGQVPVPPAPVSTTPAAPPVTNNSSPWDEELDLPETPPKSQPSVMGSLGPQENAIPQDPAPFVVPQNIEEKVGQKVPAENFVGVSTPPPAITQPQVSSQESPVPPAAATPANALNGKKNLFSFFKKNPAEKEIIPVPVETSSPDTQAQNPIPLQPLTPGNPAGAVAPAKDLAPAKRFSFAGGRKAIPILGVAVFLAFLVGLTELGLLSIGAEKVYGAIGLEKIWGGLSSDPEVSFLKSASLMKEHPNFKIKGSITMSVNSTITSPITSPLLSIIKSNHLYGSRDLNLAVYPEKAIKTATSTDGDIYDLYDTSTDSSSSASTDVTDTASDTSVSGTTGDEATLDTASSDDSSVSSDESYYTTDSETSDTQEVQASFESQSSATGFATTINVDSVSESSQIDLLLDGGALLVKSDSFEFAGNAKPGKWLSYPLENLQGKSLSESFFSIDAGSGASIKGTRSGNEKVGGIRCFRYQIDNLEIGDALSSIGITSDMVQNISGDIWIGVNDKLIHKASLKVLTPITSSVSSFTIDLEFYDFDVENNIDSPSESDVITPSAATATTASSIETLTANDTQRKSDVAKILAALKAYKDAVGSYPIAKDPLNLSLSSNIIESALVPKYIASMPVDPKGYYYGYKSGDGKKCSVSARLENTSDTEGQILGSAFLYIKYNDN